jgi:hypothetical protein
MKSPENRSKMKKVQQNLHSGRPEIRNKKLFNW